MSILMQLLDRPIAFQPSFVAIGAGVTGAVLLSQLVYWQNRMDGWFYKTQAELTTETGLTRYEQEGARKKLIAAGVLEEKLRGVPAKLFFRVNEIALETLLIQHAENQQSSMRKTRKLGCGKPADKNAENPQASLQETSEQVRGNPASIPTGDYTETTAENTTETVRPPASPGDQQAVDPQKIDYASVLDLFHTTLPELPKVIKITEARRKVLRKLWKEYDLNVEKWGAYLRYIAKKCRWMLEDRPDTHSGKTWRRKDFDYLITEGCYLKVKEERANDLPKVQKLDTAARDEAYERLISQRRKPRNEVERLAKEMAGSFGRTITDYEARKAWAGIWAQALTKASENDLARLAS